MSRFGISQNFRNVTLLGRFARTEHGLKKGIKVSTTDSSSSVSEVPSKTPLKVVKKMNKSLTSQPSANKLSAVTARYVTKSADHL